LNTTTFPPGPESKVRFSASVCDWIGALPICARIAARESVGGVEACCRRPGTPALKRLAGKSCASNALPANPAEFRNISRRVLCFSKKFGLIFFRLSNVNYVPDILEGKQQSVADISVTVLSNERQYSLIF
jgi:hypothetical protein